MKSLANVLLILLFLITQLPTGISGACPYEWTPWSNCSADCSPLGQQTQTRTCPNCQDSECGPKFIVIKRPCSEKKCCEGYPKWTEWAPKNPCFAKHGRESYVYRNCMTCKTDDQCSDGDWSKVIMCGCPKESLWGPEWADWTEWTKQGVCGYKTQTRHRHCEGGDPCPDGSVCVGKRSETRIEHHKCCKKKSKWTSWRQWSNCSATNGPGSQTRTRRCKGKPICLSEKPCLGEFEEQKVCCVAGCCANQTQWENWGSWTKCTQCGFGNQTRARKCGENGDCPQGSACLGEARETKVCKKFCRGPRWQKWSPWTTCSTTCGAGKRTRKQICTGSKETLARAKCLGEPEETEICWVWCCKDVRVQLWTAWRRIIGHRVKGTSIRRRGCHARGCKHEKTQCAVIKTKQKRV